MEDRMKAFDSDAFLTAYQEYMTEEVTVSRSRQVLRELLVVLLTVGTAGAGLLLYLAYYVFKVKQYADENDIDLFQEYEPVEE